MAIISFTPSDPARLPKKSVFCIALYSAAIAAYDKETSSQGICDALNLRFLLFIPFSTFCVFILFEADDFVPDANPLKSYTAKPI